MDPILPELQTRILKKSPSEERFDLYRASLEWELVDPIVIEDRDDLRSESKWRNRLEPYHHQVTNLITFCRRLPVTLLADDVGLGKTISAGLVLSELIARSRVTKVLIICPKILREQWKEELEVKFGVSSKIVTGRELISAKPPEEPGAVITTYNTARLYLEKMGKNGFDMLILDEAHKLRNLYGVDPTPQVALKFRKALADRMFKYVLMLTATPIQNRLWDLYSLVDLLTVARGHENPFGSPGNFAKTFISDSRTQARQLNPEKLDEFRSIVYGYMSRVRRGDAKLHFPERVVQLHRVDPSPEELKLIGVVAKSIEQFNALTQIVILQALVSSPEALVKMLEGMAKRNTVPKIFAKEVKNSASEISITTKLKGLNALIEKLSKEKPETWRLVVFTRWRETQTTIETFLSQHNINCGLINGDSAERNQATIEKFKKDLPEINVIVSTEAGSEGVNLQVANVLVNYDLPWNPMIVEQRIGRIQRLASGHANVSIFNIVLNKTFEEYIVGRLMEKLQMASHAIGDIESLLEASGVNENEDNGPGGFEEKIRQLVVASLVGKDVEHATRQAEQSISEAKVELDHEEKNINSLLGGMDEALNSGPRCPKLPPTHRSMDAQSFVLAALSANGAHLKKQTDGLYLSTQAGREEIIRFDDRSLSAAGESVLLAPGTSGFEQLVQKIVKSGLHKVEDGDERPAIIAEEMSMEWVNKIGAKYVSSKTENISRCFNGKALIRTRVTVAHDSYERLVEVTCTPYEHTSLIAQGGLEPLSDLLENPSLIGTMPEKLTQKAADDPYILEFNRFYLERRAQEIKSAGDDLRKQKKLEDEFTPRFEFTLVALEGVMHRVLENRVQYEIVPGAKYTSSLTVTPSTRHIVKPEMAKCMKTEQLVPSECLAKCEVSGKEVLKHLLISSETSGRLALPEYLVICTYSKKKVLSDEVEISSVSGLLVEKDFLKTSAFSGKRAEPTFFERCEFSNSEVLESEAAVSQISGKKYRIDEQLISAVSGKSGHREEFIYCAETKQPLLEGEAEKCEVTGKNVMPGILEICEVTQKKVVPSELEKSAASGKKALKKYIVLSSISGSKMLESEGTRSIAGKFCLPLETKLCEWSNQSTHPDDLKMCELTGVTVRSEYITLQPPPRLEPLFRLLNSSEKSDQKENWPDIAKHISSLVGGGCKVISAELSPSNRSLVVSVELRTWLGLKSRRIGSIFSLKNQGVIGHIVVGKLTKKGWEQEN